MYTGLVHIGTSKRLDLKSHSIGLSAMRLPRPDKIFNPNRAGRADIPLLCGAGECQKFSFKVNCTCRPLLTVLVIFPKVATANCVPGLSN